MKLKSLIKPSILESCGCEEKEKPIRENEKEDNTSELALTKVQSQLGELVFTTYFNIRHLSYQFLPTTETYQSLKKNSDELKRVILELKRILETSFPRRNGQPMMFNFKSKHELDGFVFEVDPKTFQNFMTSQIQ